ncbi:MAG: Deoxyinosine 3'endonuclease (endonuclease V) Nfi [Candidatus Methanohalarchaeum thermophilum]|uniref:Endonuclease V n=1 Tax=Methanohalarchaeum thermophilum TaxID=1903181 RepID=A0A1Q6DWW5_METT1|nr:MAG: Deoxyinosine 3'endonuclease (endonuclease V) Nfi [Candidatus Methanohalarchaeum thermophilum]
MIPTSIDKEDMREIQEEIKEKSIIEDKFEVNEINSVAGVDQAFIEEKKIISGSVVLNCDFSVIDKNYVTRDINFPYISGFLAFREGNSVLESIKKLKIDPDLVILDGSGILHPRKAGLATHIGLNLNKPTIGVIKNPFCGEKERNVKKVGEYSKVKIDKETVGYCFKSKSECNPIYISPGHKISKKTSLKISKYFIKNHKLPEPIRNADNYVNQVKSQII